MSKPFAPVDNPRILASVPSLTVSSSALSSIAWRSWAILPVMDFKLRYELIHSWLFNPQMSCQFIYTNAWLYLYHLLFIYFLRYLVAFIIVKRHPPEPYFFFNNLYGGFLRRSIFWRSSTGLPFGSGIVLIRVSFTSFLNSFCISYSALQS